MPKIAQNKELMIIHVDKFLVIGHQPSDPLCHESIIRKFAISQILYFL